MNYYEYQEREMGRDWGLYYEAGMTEAEAEAFKAGWRAGFDFGRDIPSA